MVKTCVHSFGAFLSQAVKPKHATRRSVAEDSFWKLFIGTLFIGVNLFGVIDGLKDGGIPANVKSK